VHDLFTGESAIEIPLRDASACLAFIDQASGAPYLAASGVDGNSYGCVKLICART
jgi:hypothetical protein